jgi:hypothetical protein
LSVASKDFPSGPQSDGDNLLSSAERGEADYWKISEFPFIFH